MYADIRVREWLKRSASTEYQKAYSTISGYIPKKEGGIFVEVACGRGEILRRAYRRGRYDLIVGTDASEMMLVEARKNIRSDGMNPNIEKDVGKIQGKRGSVLLVDDILECQLPNEFADRVVFTFPDIGADYIPKPEDIDHINKIFGIGATDPLEYSGIAVTVRVEKQLSRILKRDGILLIVVYDVSSGKESFYDKKILDDKRYMTKPISLNLISGEFFESAEVWSDTVDAREDNPDLRSLKKGYRVFEFRKG